MRRGYTRLTFAAREEISRFLAAGASGRAIASPTTVTARIFSRSMVVTTSSTSRWSVMGENTTDWPVFIDGNAGYQLANDQIPPGGTVWNFTFGFGGGFELPVDRDTALLAAIDYHHISNALGRNNDRNPSQNEARLWLGVEWTF